MEDQDNIEDFVENSTEIQELKSITDLLTVSKIETSTTEYRHAPSKAKLVL